MVVAGSSAVGRELVCGCSAVGLAVDSSAVGVAVDSSTLGGCVVAGSSAVGGGVVAVTPVWSKQMSKSVYPSERAMSQLPLVHPPRSTAPATLTVATLKTSFFVVPPLREQIIMAKGSKGSQPSLSLIVSTGGGWSIYTL